MQSRLLCYPALLAVALLILYCKPVSENQSSASLFPADSNQVAAWVTYGDQSALLQRLNQRILFKTDTVSSGLLIEVKPEQKFQQMEGFGASVTGSSAFLLNRKLSSSQRADLLEELFTSKGLEIRVEGRVVRGVRKSNQ